MTLFAQNERNRSISHRQLMQMLYISLSIRIFFLLVIDLPELSVCLWMAPLLGLVFAAPTLLCTYALLRKGDMRLSPFLRETLGAPVWRTALIVFSLAMTYDAASLFEALLNSAAYTTLYMTPDWILAVPTFFVPVIVAARGGNSVGGLGAVFLRAAPVLYLLVVLFHLRSINLAWLTPLFGSGTHTLVHAARLCATYYCMLPIGLLLDDGENTVGRSRACPVKPNGFLLLCLAIAMTISALCAVHGAMYPAVANLMDTRALRLDLVLSNGKSNQAIQLPMPILWNGTLAAALVFTLFCAGRLTADALEKPFTPIVIAYGVIAFAQMLLGFAKREHALLLAQWGLYPFTAFFLLSLLLALRRKKRRLA